MKVTKTGIETDLLEKDIKFGTDFYTCRVCFSLQSSGFCKCNEDSWGLEEEAQAWIEAGIGPTEMAAASAILEAASQQIIPLGIHFDIKENPTIAGAANDCAELASAMRKLV